jgi:hypothetical protein
MPSNRIINSIYFFLGAIAGALLLHNWRFVATPHVAKAAGIACAVSALIWGIMVALKRFNFWAASQPPPSPDDAARADAKREQEKARLESKAFYRALAQYREYITATLTKEYRPSSGRFVVHISVPSQMKERRDLLELEIVEWLALSNWSCQIGRHYSSYPSSGNWRFKRLTFWGDGLQLEITHKSDLPLSPEADKSTTNVKADL